jgi:hypothetical protein
VRTKAAEGVQAVQAKTRKVLDRGADAPRRVDEFLRDTREDVSEGHQAGREAMRSATSSEKSMTRKGRRAP